MTYTPYTGPAIHDNSPADDVRRALAAATASPATAPAREYIVAYLAGLLAEKTTRTVMSARHLASGMVMTDPSGDYRVERVQHDYSAGNVSFDVVTVDQPFIEFGGWVLDHDEFFGVVVDV